MTEPDPRFPGIGNYLDWLMSLDGLEFGPSNVDELVAEYRRMRAEKTSGRKKSVAMPVEDRIATLEQIGLASKPTGIKRRKL